MNNGIVIFPHRNAVEATTSWVKKQNVYTKALLALIFTCLTAIFAQMKFYLPWTPVPVTLQTIAVLGSGVILGPLFGGLSQLLYLMVGVMGINWFANRAGGIEVLFGPTGGYLLGFVIASFVVGLISEKIMRKDCKGIIFLGTLVSINFVIIYGLGLIQLFLWFYFTKGQTLTIGVLLAKGMVPFIIGDVLKITGMTIYMKY